ncbi:arylsulfatase [Coraliomargarita algicola]|uniref:Arylsulfatase n=1 Tax=Coraliomargarita algicola TaxID=3092156 RepID=A0ABZ0RJA0_9BACT|nr:arylsulfatase [Coraliomargarita sp. J2-16]WPJ96285.1 arylsulfatase [Coraliomargarita sp. J2-16]
MSAEVHASPESKLPNIVVILADDLGYGDVSFLNPDSKIKTPDMDALAQAGVWATDAHAPSAICSPSRYAMLTGRYPWRKMKSGRLSPWAPLSIDINRVTIPSMLQTKGYHTACIGKWHLGYNWPWKGGQRPSKEVIGSNTSTAKNDMFDWTQPIEGPTSIGFDYYFGVDCPNFPPFAFIENTKLTCDPIDFEGKSLKSKGPRGYIHGDGPGEDGWDLEAILPKITEQAVRYINEKSRESEPYFLYFSLTAPHTPAAVTKEFSGTSEAGSYGDWVVQTDDAIGQVIEAIKSSGEFENTLIIVSSDNGPEAFTRLLIQTHGHRSSAHLRGLKGDAWEGGHRVPFIASWPKGGISGGREIDATISLMDLFATTASIVEFQLEAGVADDSLNMLPSLLQDAVVRDEMIYHSGRAAYGLRQGDWVYLRKGGSKEEPEWYLQAQQIKSAAASDELFNLADDEAQQYNVSSNHPERVAMMKARILEIEQSASTR